MSGNIAESPAAAKNKVFTRRHFLQAGTAAAGMALYSGEIARHEISCVTQTISLKKLPPAFENFRIAQISDIHFDWYTEPFFLRRVLGRLNALKPDLVLMTGDFISFGFRSRNHVLDSMEQCAQILREIDCPQRYAVMGNHDSFLGAPTVVPILAESAIPMLVNQYVPIERGGQRLWLCGIHDPVTHIPDLTTAIPERPDGPVLLMSHGPDYADTLLANPRGQLVDVMFSGHTHGGQVRLPFLPPMHLPSGGQKYVEGLFHLDHMQLYVSRGIGTVGLPIRLNCPPEITLFTLTGA